MALNCNFAKRVIEDKLHVFQHPELGIGRTIGEFNPHAALPLEPTFVHVEIRVIKTNIQSLPEASFSGRL